MGEAALLKELDKPIIKLSAVYRFACFIDDIMREEIIQVGVIHLLAKQFFNRKPVIFIQLFLVIRIHQKEITDQVSI